MLGKIIKYLFNVRVVGVIDGGADLFTIIGEVEDRFSPVIIRDDPVHHINIDQSINGTADSTFIQG